MALTEKDRINIENVINQIISDFESGKKKNFVISIQNLANDAKTGEDRQRDFWLLLGERLRSEKVSMKNFVFNQDANTAKFSLEPQVENVDDGKGAQTAERSQKKTAETSRKDESPGENTPTASKVRNDKPNGQKRNVEPEQTKTKTENQTESVRPRNEERQEKGENFIYVPSSYAEPQKEHKVTNVRQLKPREVNPYFSAVMKMLAFPGMLFATAFFGPFPVLLVSSLMMGFDALQMRYQQMQNALIIDESVM